MQSNVAQSIVSAADNIGIEIELREEYSGRGMFGASTAGIVVENIGQLCQALVALVREMSEYESYVQEKVFGCTIDEVEDAMSRLKTDSMGHAEIIY